MYRYVHDVYLYVLYLYLCLCLCLCWMLLLCWPLDALGYPVDEDGMEPYYWKKSHYGSFEKLWMESSHSGSF